MDEKSAKSDGSSAMSAAVTANEQARAMIIAIGGPRRWNDTKESWRARIARKVALINPRRVRAILSGERLRLTADEYLAIKRVYDDATTSLAAFSHLASEADAEARAASLCEGGGDEGRRSAPDPRELDTAGRTVVR